MDEKQLLAAALKYLGYRPNPQKITNYFKENSSKQVSEVVEEE